MINSVIIVGYNIKYSSKARLKKTQSIINAGCIIFFLSRFFMMLRLTVSILCREPIKNNDAKAANMKKYKGKMKKMGESSLNKGFQ
jgi:hypothetical protein